MGFTNKTNNKENNLTDLSLNGYLYVGGDISFSNPDAHFFVAGDASFNREVDISGLNVAFSLETLFNDTAIIDNSLQILQNITSKNEFQDISYTTQTHNIQDLSQVFYHEIKPINNQNPKILVDINTTLYCCYALEERITVELWRDTTKLIGDNNLGSINATGGLTIPYHLSYLDKSPSSSSINRYYLKYQLENNNSNQLMGLSTTGSSSIILREV